MLFTKLRRIKRIMPNIYGYLQSPRNTNIDRTLPTLSEKAVMTEAFIRVIYNISQNSLLAVCSETLFKKKYLLQNLDTIEVDQRKQLIKFDISAFDVAIFKKIGQPGKEVDLSLKRRLIIAVSLLINRLTRSTALSISSEVQNCDFAETVQRYFCS
ncbi:hypothetical protein EGR_07497 [Echinococcus granulosus]|uniref:Uncharacterized protein n=1 Tax=Echinococcus granulosus TaxID=6210 RepID=W6UAP8_ECHGR|nr:hypothetical protein EGR_07497 [Echinococcus granulosus]EUB57621.1 hypothetical protein EGR_07497 [Echinococcus granulosus]